MAPLKSVYAKKLRRKRERVREKTICVVLPRLMRSLFSNGVGGVLARAPALHLCTPVYTCVYVYVYINSHTHMVCAKS